MLRVGLEGGCNARVVPREGRDEDCDEVDANLDELTTVISDLNSTFVY